MGLSEWLPVSKPILSETSQATVALLRSLIANIEAGNVVVLDRSGIQTNNATVELTLILNGHPDETLSV